MEESLPTRPEGRPARPWERVNAACDRFEAAWRAGPPPRIEDYLAAAEEADRAALLRELVALERELRRRRGDRPGPQEYLDRFPGYPGIVRAAFGAPPDPGGAPGARPQADTGRNLLFGILALQNNFIGRDDLLGAFATWVANKTRPLAQVLVDRGALDGARRALLEALVAEHLKQHGGDTAASLAAVSSLGSVCGDLERLGDPDLQASLAATTSRAAAAGSDAGARATYAPSSRRAGARFRILHFHREGGLGRVYRAHDEELGREVALKEIRPDKVGEAELRTRFVLEAEINGGLEHPGIVPVYSLGTYDDGRPFYAMRFVEGDSLKEAIESYHQEHPRPDPTAVEFRKLLGRFVDVCEAIAFAHSKGVLHRDLKPQNVMLGRYGETLLIDWGLAKATGRREPSSAEAAAEATLVPPSGSGHAPTLGVLGSPPYMSPEQAAGAMEALGPATDVYGLGAILFALLTGQPPVQGGTAEEVLDQARRGAIRSLRSLNPNVPRGLEAVCLKALALKPQDRYPTALALAEEVEHWLADEPVSAWREPTSLRTRRWMRRHRTLVASTVAVFVFGAFGLAGFAMVLAAVNRELDRQRQAAVESQKRARDGEAKAKKSEAETKATLEFFREKVVAAARPKDQGGGLGIDATLRAALDAAEPAIATTFADQPTVAAAVRASLGTSYLYLGVPELAIRQHEQALALRRQSLGPDHPDTLDSLDHLAVAYEHAGQLDRAIALHEQVWDALRSQLGADDPRSLMAMSNLAVAYHDAGRLDRAVELHEQVLQARRAKLGEDHHDTLTSMNNLAAAYHAVGQLDRALPLYEQVLTVRRAKWGGNHPETLLSMTNLAATYRDMGQLDRAIPLHEQALQGKRVQLGPAHPDTLLSMSNLATAYHDAGQLDRSIALHEEALQAQRATLGPDHFDTVVSMNNLAMAYWDAGRPDRAIPLLEQALQAQRATLGESHPNTLLFRNNLARAYLVGQPGRAEPHLREALSLREKRSPDDWATFETRSLLGASLLGQKKYTDAEPLLLQGYQGMRAREAKIPGRYKKRLAEAGRRVVDLYDAWGKAAEAAAWKAKLGMPDLPADVFAQP